MMWLAMEREMKVVSIKGKARYRGFFFASGLGCITNTDRRRGYYCKTPAAPAEFA
jgi:hypothetical protein